MATLFVEQLTVIDCSLLDPDDGLVGESFIVDVELSGALDEQGMVLDFGAVKKYIKQQIDGLVDHRLLVPLRHDGLLISDTAAALRLRFTDKCGLFWEHESPHCAVTGINEKRIDSERLASWLAPRIEAGLPAGLSLRLQLRHESVDGVFYRYSHGLQKHNGACQRIAHGHRSRLHIFDSTQRRADWESEWAQRFENVYLITQHHLRREWEHDGEIYCELSYQSQEGEYRLIVPKKRSYIMDNETTVEWIAAHIARCCAKEHHATVTVRAFEGVQKGAIATA